MGRARECKHGHESGCVKCGPDPVRYTEENARGVSATVQAKPAQPRSTKGVVFKSADFECVFEIEHLPRCGDLVEIPNRVKWWVSAIEWMPAGTSRMVPVVRLITAAVS